MQKIPLIFEYYKKLLLGTHKINSKFILLTIVFFAAAILGYHLAEQNATWTATQIENLSANFEGLEDKSALYQFCYVFINNSFISLMIILTFFLFGITSFFTVLSNGVVLGIIIQYSLSRLGADNVFLALAPHGIIELPAFFLAAAVSLKLSEDFYALLKRKKPFKKEFLWSLKYFILIVFPLLVLASFIEIFITPRLLFI